MRWILALVLLGAAQVAAAFERTTVPGTSVCLYWNQREIPWTAHEAGNVEIGPSRTFEVIRRSFLTWEDVPCSDLRFREQPASSSRAVGWRRGEPADDLILFRTRRCADDGVAPAGDPCWLTSDCGNAYDCWAYADGVIAQTTTSYNSTTGELIDADIELNAANFYFTTIDGVAACEPPDFEDCVATDLQNTVTHEIGHVVGLAHSDVAEATMSPDAPLGDLRKRTLAADDVSGLCEMYPPGEPPLTCFEQFRLVPTERGGAGCAAGGPTSPGLLPGVLACLRLLRRRSGIRAGGAGTRAG